MAKAVNIAKITLPAEDLLGPFARETQITRKWAQKFNDLSNVIIVFAVLGARLRVKEVITGD